MFTHAQGTDANVFGHVIANGEHLPFADVFIEGTSMGTVTDATGHYKLVNLPPGEHVLVARSMGYKQQRIPITLKAGESIEVNFELMPDQVMLDQAVVTGERKETTQKDSPLRLQVIPMKTFEACNAIDFKEVMDYTPGLRTENNCQNCGFSQLRMNGLEGPYTQILINSRPVFSGLAGVYGLDLIPAAMIERVEVNRGGGSSLYGGNAIAGTVNIILREPTDHRFELGADYGLIGLAEEGDSPAFDRSVNISGSVVADNNKAGISYFLQKRSKEPWDANGDGYSELVMADNLSGGFNTVYKITDLSKLSLNYYTINEERRGGNKFDAPPHEADIAEFTEHRLNGGDLSFETFLPRSSLNKLTVYSSAQHLGRDSYYGAEQDPSAYGESQSLTLINGAQYHLHYGFLDSSSLMLGGDYLDDHLEDRKLPYTDPISGNYRQGTVIADQRMGTMGLFAQNKNQVGDLTMSYGLRLDNYRIEDLHDGQGDVNGSVLVPRLNAMYDLGPYDQVRFGYGMGYRAPQLFNEDLHIESSGARSIIHRNSPGLKEETSHSFTASYMHSKMYDAFQLYLMADGFYTLLNDPFSSSYTAPDSSGTVVYLRDNATEGAIVAGVNLEAKIAPNRRFDVQMGFTFQQSRYNEEQQWGEEEGSSTRRFLRTPDVYGYTMIYWSPLRHLKSFLTLNYTGPMRMPHLPGGLDPEGYLITEEELVKTQPFYVFNLKLSYDFHLSNELRLVFSTGMKNILNSYQDDFDRGINRDAAYVYGPALPRMVFAGIKLSH